MADSIDKTALSASAGGRPILVAATATPGTLIHTTGISAATLDEVWLYAYNHHTAALNLTVEFGGTTSPGDVITLSVPSRSGLTLVIPGLILSGDGAAGRSVRAYAQTANLVSVVGHVHRIA